MTWVTPGGEEEEFCRESKKCRGISQFPEIGHPRCIVRCSLAMLYIFILSVSFATISGALTTHSMTLFEYKFHTTVSRSRSIILFVVATTVLDEVVVHFSE